MSDANKAVFLSYASQDAEAVERIANALRAAGVEVWFDRNELVGGDAWDAKIRGQIASCALFVPVISANTQARREGYFRIEWKLAAQRTHAMADGTPFLLPVVIDATRDAEALVPAEFKSVQWTRLRPSAEGGQGLVRPPASSGGQALDDTSVRAFCARVEKLLGSSAVVEPAPASAEPGPKHRAALEARRGVPVAVWVGAIVAVAAVVGFFVLRPEPETRGGVPAPAATTPPVSEANRLVAKAWEQMDKTEMARNELLLAEGFCRQAAALEETNPAVWAAWSAMNTWFYFHQFDRAPARKEAARDYAQKALALDPKSYDARYAWAHFIVRMTAEGKTGDERPALPILRELLRERPDEPRALYALGFALICDPANVDEGFATLERLAERHPWFAGRALNELGWFALFHGRFALADSAADRALKAQPYWNNLGLKATLALRLHGDVELAQATVNRLPSTALQENWGITLAVTVADWRGDHARAVEILQAVPRDWLENFFYYGPTSFLSGWMRLKAKQVTAAKKDFRRALELIGARLEKTPNDVPLVFYKAEALRLLGDSKEAEATYLQLRELWPNTLSRLTFEPPAQALSYVREMARRDHNVDAFPFNWLFTAASLRRDPLFENVRGEPGFSDLVEEVERREKQRRLQSTASAGQKTVAVPVDRAAAPDKSVAVLAFANLSDDKTNEYFSDGISEELLTILQKIPGLRVAARTSAFSFKGKNVTAKEVGEKLGMAHVVEGSVQKFGTRVKITARLSRAAFNEEVWSESFGPLELTDVFATQSEIAQKIVAGLRGQLTGGATTASAEAEIKGQIQAATKGGTGNAEAYRLYRQGRYHFAKSTQAGWAEAERCFNAALQLDPRFARAYSGLADLYGFTGGYLIPGRTAWAKQRELAEKALALEPDLADARFSLGLARASVFEWKQAEEEIVRAIGLNPNLALARDQYAWLLTMNGRMEEALRQSQQALELDPLSPVLSNNRAGYLLHMGRDDEAVAQARRTMALQPNDAFARALIGWALTFKGDHEAAARQFREARALDDLPWFAGSLSYALARAGDRAGAEAMLRELDTVATQRWVATGVRVYVFLGLGDRGRALDALEKAYEEQDPLCWNMKVDRVFDPIRHEPRFRVLQRKAGLD